MHLIEGNDQLVVGDTVYYALGAAFFTTTLIPIALVQPYDVTWAENSQLLLQLVVFVASFSSVLWVRGIGALAVLCAPCEVQEDATIHTCSHMLDE